ncbi:hypothetical protein [Dinghuibacter silviterrae]|uniref:DUF2846 domain-containing protein n=1 Tax=Dinghuibacter silviterrae TaxID=1539049 RepID=A0A4R8DPG0_9BACT|nr:hypothetical protein [Dinghuibacter silviterrae]TDW99615.1 hypothetical protein EDB95_0625 [Dinghuibacter silviterrae]
MRTILLIGLTLLACRASAQEDTSLPARTVYVVRPSQYIGALAKIRVDINGRRLSLPNASYAVLHFRADSVQVRIENRRVTGESVQPLVNFKDTSYFVVFPEEHAHKKDRLIVTEVEKDSYEKFADKVTHQVEPEH